MLYRSDKYGNKISQLGFGCMRFPKKGGSIDFEKTEEQILHAIEQGINYFDTAYIYPGSEECLGKILDKNGKRKDIYIATKLPQYVMRSLDQVEKTFNEELTRLKTDYIDYYLMHMFTDIHEWEKLKDIGIEGWIQKKKAEGKIRNIGFSYHGDTDMFIKVLNAYDWDFCQIQYNYLDEHTQAGRKGLMAAAEKGIPVIIMEPLRGGKLVNLPEKAMKAIKDSGTFKSSAEMGLKWLWDQSQVTCVLSGMNSMEMLDENLRIAGEAHSGEFGEKERLLVEQVKAVIKEKEKVGCTGCRYCMPCPKGVDIPGNFFYYNLTEIDGKLQARLSFAQTTALRVDPPFASQCIGCGKCEQHCPQHIEIRKMLKQADKTLRPWYFKPLLALARKIISRKNKKTTKD